MNLTISGHHITVSDAMRTHLEAKLETLTRHFDHLIDASVVLRFEAGQPNCQNSVEATLHVPGQDLHAKACGDDMYAAIDGLMARLDRQVTKYKSKLRSHRETRLLTRDVVSLAQEMPESMAA